MRKTYTEKVMGLTQADGARQIKISPGDGARLHQVQIDATAIAGTIKFRLRTPGCPATFIPVDEFETETIIDLSKTNRIAQLYGFSDLIEVVPEGIVGAYDVYVCSGGE